MEVYVTAVLVLCFASTDVLLNILGMKINVLKGERFEVNPEEINVTFDDVKGVSLSVVNYYLSLLLLFYAYFTVIIILYYLLLYAVRIWRTKFHDLIVTLQRLWCCDHGVTCSLILARL